MKIAEICPFSSGACGVWTRVLAESMAFVKKGHQVKVFSSNLEKGTLSIVSEKCAVQDTLTIERFPVRKSFFSSLLSENVLYWMNAEAIQALESYAPDTIIVHLIHPHTVALARNLKRLREINHLLKVFVVPHAPFNIQRKFPLNLATIVWRMMHAKLLRKFDKVITIAQWEKPYLLDMGVKEENLAYIPNGLPNEYFIQKKLKSPIKGDVLFLGRIAPVKDLETLLNAAFLLPNISFSIVGPAEPYYRYRLSNLLEKAPNAKLYPPVYDLKQKISIMDSHTVFVLPSKREAMPQALLEAMSRGLVVISSSTDGGKELIRNQQNGYLFEIGDASKLARLIQEGLNNAQTGKIAKEDAKQFAWSSLIKTYESLF